MALLDPTPSPWAGKVRSIVRIVAGLCFISFGTMKLFAFPPYQGMPVPWLSQAGIGGMLEVAGGALVTLGLLTRPVAFLLSGEMAVAYFQFHFPTSPWPSVNMGTPAILYCFLWLYLVFAGPGEWSLDAWITRARSSSGRASPAPRRIAEA